MRLDPNELRLADGSVAALQVGNGPKRRAGSLFCAVAFVVALSTAGGFLPSCPRLFAQNTKNTECFQGPIPPDENPQYFPTGVFTSTPRGSFTAALNACRLRAMDERPLIPSASVTGRGVYRLLVEPTWEGLFLVRLNVGADGSGTLVKKEARSQLQPGILTVNMTLPVSKEDVGVFDSLLQKNNFWSMSPILVFPKDPSRPLPNAGGVVCVLEGAKPDAYHVVTRPLGEDPKGLDELTWYLFRDLAKFEIPPPPAWPRKGKR